MILVNGKLKKEHLVMMKEKLVLLNLKDFQMLMKQIKKEN